ncbi:MAG: M23 family metallopeptidase [Methylococcaceae bacterium]
MLAQKLVFIALVYSLSCSVQASPTAPRLTMPLACRIGVDCFIQNYVDIDDSGDYSDYRCGFLSYDDHRGTDFRPKAVNALAIGIPVLAADDGKVRAIRDGMDDINVRIIGKEAIKDREAGNSVVIVHGKDWESQYAHLKKGSITVQAGQVVKRGTVLGQVGLSGNTEFTHLHFEIRHQGKPVDPFMGISGGEPCTAGKQPLWTKETFNKIPYIATDILAAGFSDHALGVDEVLAESMRLAADAPVLVFWSTLFGVQTNDVEVIQLYAPDNSVLLEQHIPIDHNMAQYRGFVGLKRKTEYWTKGDYRLNFQLLRQEHAIVQKDFKLTID